MCTLSQNGYGDTFSHLAFFCLCSALDLCALPPCVPPPPWRGFGAWLWGLECKRVWKGAAVGRLHLPARRGILKELLTLAASMKNADWDFSKEYTPVDG